MLYSIADLVAKHVQNHLANDKEEDAKGNLEQRPAILKRVCDEEDLHDNVYQQEYRVEQIKHDEEANRVGRTETCPSFEGEKGHCPADYEHSQRAQSQQPDGERRAIFVELKPNEAVDQEADAECRGKTILSRRKVWKRAGAGRNYTRIEDEGETGE